jgi:hypothetical protein
VSGGSRRSGEERAGDQEKERAGDQEKNGQEIRRGTGRRSGEERAGGQEKYLFQNKNARF